MLLYSSLMQAMLIQAIQTINWLHFSGLGSLISYVMRSLVCDAVSKFCCKKVYLILKNAGQKTLSTINPTTGIWFARESWKANTIDFVGEGVSQFGLNQDTSFFTFLAQWTLLFVFSKKVSIFCFWNVLIKIVLFFWSERILFCYQDNIFHLS